ncbi:protease, partial [Candidatus Saccharibacteria bacterium]|nr:protease [Candidatus Saccharibacteria bacterium]
MYSAIEANKRKTVLLMVVFIALIAGLGWVFSQIYGDLYIFWGTFAGSLVYVLIQYFASAKLALSMNGAKEIQKQDDPRLWRIVENLAISQGMPMPKVYIVDDPAPNAFATGRDPQHSHVAATTGILEILSDAELEGVMAHEMSHVKNYDIRVSLIAFGLTSAIGMIADLFMRMMWFGGDNDNRPSHPAFLIAGIVAAILSPLVAALIQAAISRQREYLADASGAEMTRYPEGLASALQKLGQVSTATRRQNPSSAHLF